MVIVMDITSVNLLVDEKRSVLEKKLKNPEVDEFDIEDLDKKDCRKDVVIIFKDVVDARYVYQKLHDILGECGTKRDTE